MSHHPDANFPDDCPDDEPDPHPFIPGLRMTGSNWPNEGDYDYDPTDNGD